MVRSICVGAVCIGALVVMADVSTGQDRGASAAERTSVESEGPADDLARLIAGLESDDPKARARAALDCVRLGSKAAPAMPSLIDALGDERFAASEPAFAFMGTVDKDVQDYAAEALAAIGPSVLPHLRKAFEQGGAATRAGVVKTLDQLGRLGAPAVPWLRGALENPDPEVRADAVRALGRIGPEAKQAAAAVVDLLETEPADSVRRQIIAALAALEPEAENVARHLAYVLGQKTIFGESLRQLAVERLRGLDLEAKIAVPLLVRALEDESTEVRAAAIRGLKRYGPEAAPAVPLLVACLEDDSTYQNHAISFLPAGTVVGRAEARPLRWLVPDALASIGPPARPAVPALKQLIEAGDDPEVRKAALDALGKIQQGGERPGDYQK